MKEKLSRQARHMCRQCHYKNVLNNTCEDGASIKEQNQRAKSRQCIRAGIQGGTFGRPYTLDTVLGDMIRLKGGAWIFEGRNYTRFDEEGKPKSRVGSRGSSLPRG